MVNYAASYGTGACDTCGKKVYGQIITCSACYDRIFWAEDNGWAEVETTTEETPHPFDTPMWFPVTHRPMSAADFARENERRTAA